MKFFYSPKKLIEYLKERESIARRLKERDNAWFFSEEGRRGYEDAKTPAQKTRYFYDYLMTFPRKYIKDKDKRFKIAYIMALTMDQSSLEFAGYPNILDPGKNPLVNCVKNDNIITYACGLTLLAALHGDKNPEKAYDRSHSRHKPYTKLTQCEPDGTLSDLYKIERAIIAAFCMDNGMEMLTGYDTRKPYMPPYTYDILESNDTELNEINSDDDDDSDVDDSDIYETLESI